MGRLRVPFFVVALVAIGLVVLVELCAPLIVGGRGVSADVQQAAGAGLPSLPAGAAPTQPAGRGIPYLALIDLVALFTVGLMALGLLVPDRLHARLQGGVTLVAGAALVIVALGLLAAAVAALVTMVTLFFAAPFGTIGYLIVWGFFPRGDAAILLSLLMFLKLVFVVMLILAQPRFLQNKGLVALLATSLLANVVLAVLHGLVPVILVSITDDVGAIVFAAAGLVWGIVLVIGSVPAIVNALRASQPSP
jgi:hypothetical protein